MKVLYNLLIKNARADANRSGLRRKMRGESALSATYSDMIESYVKRRKRYVNNTKDKYKLTFLIHGPGNSSYKCKVLGDFGSKYFKIIPNKYHGREPATKNKFIIQKDNNIIYMVQTNMSPSISLCGT